MTAHSAIKRAGGATEDRKRPLSQDPRPRHLQIISPVLISARRKPLPYPMITGVL